MMYAVAAFVIGSLAGFGLTVAAVTDAMYLDAFAWTAANLGHSTWAFLACLICYLFTLSRLRYRIESHPSYQMVVQLDQLSDVWIHVFVGIGVIWTAIGMRSALVNTLSVPDSLASDASQVLTRLVDGGILLALSTTIVGAIGGYLMRLFKTMSLGALLTDFYQRQEREGLEHALDRLKNIERLLESLSFEGRST